ncbi:MAG: hypothetical protein AAGM45_04405 [Cyanobacteria bacterium J06588_5]
MRPLLKRHRQPRALLTALFALCAAVVVLFGKPITAPHPAQISLPIGQSAAVAQPSGPRRVHPNAIAAEIYQQLPNLPLENQYISTRTGTAATEDTLVSRIIRYHVYIKQRPSVFRLDWKLTMADYLGAFERIAPDEYPDYNLRENPRANDIEAIAALTREQRNELVNALYEAFTTPADATEPPLQ